MLRKVGSWLTESIANIRAGKHLEAYSLLIIGILLSVVGVLGVASTQVMLASILLGVTFLIFHSTVSRSSRGTLDSLLQSRDSFGPLAQTIKGATSVCVYAPTAVNVLVHAADLRNNVLERGGTARFVVQDPHSPLVKAAEAQLDDALDFHNTLGSSITTLERLSSAQSFRYRLSPVSPGFSIVVVDGDAPNGFAIVEFHGFQDRGIAERMHIVVSRSDSIKWFDYWKQRFEKIWEASREP